MKTFTGNKKIMIITAAALVVVIAAAGFLIFGKIPASGNSGDLKAAPASSEDIIRDYMPKCFDPVINADTMEYPGHWKGNIWPGVSQEMEKAGWEMYDAMGSSKYYEREISGKTYRITVTISERGGPEEKEATTLLKIGFIKDDAEN
jgi:hypothetical protein